MAPELTIELEPEQLTVTEGVAVLQQQRQPRPVPAFPAPGPAARVTAAPPAKGNGSRPRR
jgi:hypothetical protein